MDPPGEPPGGLRGDAADRVGDLPGEGEERHWPHLGDPSEELCGERGDTERLPFQPPTPGCRKLDRGICTGTLIGPFCACTGPRILAVLLKASLGDKDVPSMQYACSLTQCNSSNRQQVPQQAAHKDGYRSKQQLQLRFEQQLIC